MTTPSDLLNILRLYRDLELRIERLEAIINEQRSFVVASSFPVDGFEGQVVLRTDLTGTNSGGQLYRFDSATSTWLAVT